MSAPDAIAAAVELRGLLSCSSALDDPDTAQRALDLVAALASAAEAAERAARRQSAALRELAGRETRRLSGLKRKAIPTAQRDAERAAVAEAQRKTRAGGGYMTQLATAKYIAGRLRLPLRRVRGYLIELRQATCTEWPKTDSV